MINAQKLECDVGGVKFYPLSYDRSVKKSAQQILVNSERFGFDESLLELFDDLGLTKDGETFVISASQFDDGISYIENESFTVFDIADFLKNYAKTTGLDYKVKIYPVNSEQYGLRFYDNKENTDELAMKDLSVALENIGLNGAFYTDDEGNNMITLTRKDIADAIGYNKEFAVDKDYINKLLFVVSALNNHFKMSGSGLTAKVSSFDNYEIFFFDKDGIKAERFNETFLSLMRELNDLDLNVLLTQKSGLYVSESDIDDIHSYLGRKMSYSDEKDSQNIFDLLSMINKRLYLPNHKLGISVTYGDSYTLSFHNKENGKEDAIDFGKIDIALPLHDAVSDGKDITIMTMPKDAVKDAYAYLEAKELGEDLPENIFNYLHNSFCGVT